MQYIKTISVCSEIQTKHINEFREQNRIFYVKRGGTYSDHWALKGYCL